MSKGSDHDAASSPPAASAGPVRLPLVSADPLAPRYVQLKALFPMAVTDGRLDMEKLRAVMGEHVAAGPERYGLSWAGKSDALKALRQLTTATLLPAPSESVNWDTTSHAIIEGDNLEVLKVLQHAYHGKVKLIYIDPPYNTGGDFIYPDDYAEGLASYQLFTRQVNEEGHRLTTNVNTSGRYHSRWLTMIYPRLFLARSLLREDGVIFVSIDDHEVHNLRLVMDEIFGEENFLGLFTWKARAKPVNIGEARIRPQLGTEYVACYARLSGRAKFYEIKSGEKRSYPHSLGKRRYRLQTILKSNRGINHRSTMSFPLDGYVPPVGQRWQAGEEEIKLLHNGGYIEFREGTPFRRYFEDEEADEHEPLYTFVAPDASDTSESGKQELNALLGNQHGFDTVKPLALITVFLKAACGPDDIVMDFFAGSGTTAHAVLELNKEDGGKRKFILVQLPEPTGGKDFPTIAEITKERARRVIQRLENEKAGELSLAGGAAPDLGFKVFKLAPSNFAVWDPALATSDPAKLAEQWQLTADNVRADVHEQALLHELMLKCGLPLASRVETTKAGAMPVFRLDDGKLIICLVRELTREALRAMIDLKPQSVLCLDVGFKGNDSLKVNAQLEFASHGIQFRTA
jgi:adenine-specific DNA-methyltransferase